MITNILLFRMFFFYPKMIHSMLHNSGWLINHIAWSTINILFGASRTSACDKSVLLLSGDGKLSSVSLISRTKHYRGRIDGT